MNRGRPHRSQLLVARAGSKVSSAGKRKASQIELAFSFVSTLFPNLSPFAKMHKNIVDFYLRRIYSALDPFQFEVLIQFEKCTGVPPVKSRKMRVPRQIEPVRSLMFR
jgi:hypothetical protein